jgi:(R,R)-butanediol dehydrogenase/meso-butanediol dehydrogenase/diacetyl reductase
MRQAVFKGARNFVVEETPRPTVIQGGILIKVAYCSICGSDVHLWEKDPDSKDPGDRSMLRATSEAFGGIPPHLILGHQYSGEVVEVGAGVTSCRVGDRVVGRGAQGYGEYTQTGRVYALPDKITYEQASFVEPLSVTVEAVRRSRLQLGDVVVVQGAGTIGLFTLQAARAAGARRIYLTEISDARLEKARGFQPDELIDVKKTDPVARVRELTAGRGPDIVFDCTGNPEANRTMIELLPRRGRAVVMSSYLGPFELDWNRIMLKSVDVLGLLAGTPGDWNARCDAFEVAIHLLETGQVRVDPLITAVVPLEKINEAFAALAEGREMAVLVKP